MKMMSCVKFIRCPIWLHSMLSNANQLELRVSELQVQRSNRSAMLPPLAGHCLFFIAVSQQHKPYTDRSSCSKTCFHVSIIECPFTLNPWQSLTFFGLFETSSWREERDGRYFHTLYKQRVRKPRTRTSTCIKNLLTCKILTMVMPNVCLFVFCVFAPFSRRKFIHRLRPVFFQLCYGRLHKSSPPTTLGTLSNRRFRRRRRRDDR